MSDKKHIENIYPRVPPSAPVEQLPLIESEFVQLPSVESDLWSAALSAESNQANDYRLKHIKDVQFELKRNLEIRNSLRKRYSNLNSSLDYSNYALNTVSCLSGVSSVSLLSTIALVPVSVVLGGVSAGCGVVSIIVSKLNKKFKHKQDKHRDLSNLCENKLNTINSILSKALKDGFISDYEFDLILKEEKHFREMKESIRNKKIIEKDNHEMKESIINFVKKIKQ